MHFLVSNDDGIEARGIQVLSERMRALGKVTLVAPDKNCSGASNSLTLDSPVRIDEIGERTYRVRGTPTDCVHIALTGLLEKDPDIVVSGINAGANMGDDVIYSGTVAAAMEGCIQGLPAAAMSLADWRPRDFGGAAALGIEITQTMTIDGEQYMWNAIMMRPLPGCPAALQALR